MRMRKGIAGIHIPRMQKDEWLTPPELLSRLGEFDLDPCSPIKRPWDTAKHHYTRKNDGLSKQWKGRVWLNPPYGTNTHRWMKKLAKHGNGIALIFARTETKIFFECVWPQADALYFINGRLTFCDVKGNPAPYNSGAPSVLVAYGENNVAALKRLSKKRGKFIQLRL